MIDFSNFDSLYALVNYFSDDEICRQTIIESRWGKDGMIDIVCPYCGQHHCVERKDGKFRCKKCRRNFSCLVGTVMENTKLSLQKWFMAMYLISSHKKGISSHQLAKDLSTTQNTAWYLLHKIRNLYKQDDSEVYSGDIECDEVYIGGREKWKHESMRKPHTQGRSTVTKTPVFGILKKYYFINENGDEESMSLVKGFVVKKTDSDTLIPIIQQFVKVGSSVSTDELSSYKKLGSLGYNHSVVKHGCFEYVSNNGQICTNCIEGFWSHFRRMITGIYHNVSDEHLQSYIDEATYRWNTRKASESERFTDMFAKSIGLIVKWDELKLCKKEAA